ncbi:MAG: adenylate/guanylate cyclase domain-containing protein [Chloroflexi bacterium]|nr:MAG: adenylate/guanylate cyclase domain-containing protein [Chloroflexota bacterium]
MSELPRGTVTFLFTDIESSTRLLREQPESYARQLAEHRANLRDAFRRHRGVEVDTQGDAFFVAFSRASDAVAAAEDAQRGLEDSQVRVRMGIHTGEPVVTDEGYVGLDVHRAARIAAAGHGGQILLSQSARDLVGRNDVRDLGKHRLKDLPAPERIYQLGSGEFPPLRSLHATHLPMQLTPFVGRRRELEAARSLLSRDGVRLVTMTGAGGSGKTRLALEAAAAVADDHEDGVWWVPLSGVSMPEDLLPAVGRVLGSGRATEAIGSRRILLLLDNFEQIIAAAPEVSTLLADCAHLVVLVTSRERLALQGEHVYPVPVLAREDSLQLFQARAHAVGSDFEPNQRLDELCARLDDLPLAIELAAARTSLLTIDQMLERLGSRLDLLRAGRDTEARHQTLRATIEWSYELLNRDERHLLGALSVFRGTWTIDAAEWVAGATLDLLQSLVNKSLVLRPQSGRFAMLETVRDFAAEHLTPRERDRLLGRLVEHQLKVFENANLGRRADGHPQMNLANAERPNLDVGLAWAGESGHADSGIRLLVLTEMYWNTTDPAGGRERLDRLLAEAGEAGKPLDLGLQARAYRFRGATFDLTDRFDLSEPEYARSLEMFRAAREEDQTGHLIALIGNSALRQGHIERAIDLATQSLEIARREGNPGDEGFALYVLAMAAFHQGDTDTGVRLAHESAPLTLKGGSIWFAGTTLLGAAEFLIAAGRIVQAEHDLATGLEYLASVSDRLNVAFALAGAAAIAALKKDAVRAGTLWGALEALKATAAGELRTSTGIAMDDNIRYIDPIRGAAFEKGRGSGRVLSLEAAIEFALTTGS